MSYLIDLGATTGSGLFVRGLAAETLGDRAVVYSDSTSQWRLADADATASMPVIGITLEPIPIGMYGQILIWGVIGDASWAWTIGNAIYASLTAGGLTQTKPSAQEYPHLQSIALPVATTLIMFNPAFKFDVLNDVVMMNDFNWDDLRFPVGAVKLGSANPPDEQLYKGGLVLSYPSNANRIAYVTAQMPHTWVEGTNIVVHMHWTIPASGAGLGAENVKFDLTHSWANVEAAFPGEATLTFTQDVQNVTLDTHLFNTWTTISGAGKTFSSMLILSIERDVSVLNDYADKAYLVEFDIHYQRDRLGTFSETPP